MVDFYIRFVLTTIFTASTGEKMSEPEIDALMQGQEDENGMVHYEGTCQVKVPLIQPIITCFNAHCIMATALTVSLALIDMI